MKIFLDANVLFSGSNPQSNIHQFLYLLNQDHQLITSPYAFEEARRNIELKRPAWLSTLESLKPKIMLCANTPLLVEIALVDKDRPILGAAIGAQCDYLLTGDKKDFGHLYGTKIETVTVIDYVTIATLLLKI